MSHLKEGDCILCESSWFIGQFGYPRVVTKISGQRVYWKQPEYKAKNATVQEWREGYCSLKSVMYTVPSLEVGMQAWEDQRSAAERRDAKKKEAEDQFRREMSSHPNLSRHERKKVKT